MIYLFLSLNLNHGVPKIDFEKTVSDFLSLQ